MTLPGAFAVSFPKINRVRERSRAFIVPARGSRVCAATTANTDEDALAEKRVFLVAERTIGGLDDIVYEKHSDVWEHLPRGNARVFVISDADPRRKKVLEDSLRELATCGDARRLARTSTMIAPTERVPVGAINGLRKFSYNTKEAESKGRDYGYEDSVDAVVALDKENGECGHISAFVLRGTDKGSDGGGDGVGQAERYWMLGSKNVHVVLPFRFTEADVKETYKARRYSYAAKIALQWKEVMDLSEENERRKKGEAATNGAPAFGVDRETFKDATLEGIARFHDLLAENNYTACFEAIFRDSQHLVDYKNQNGFRFFALTDNTTYEAPKEKGQQNSLVCGLCVDIQQSFRQFADCGLPTVPIYYGRAGVDSGSSVLAPLHKVPYRTEAYDALVDDIGHRQNSEGCVMYGYKTKELKGTETSRVVKVWKEKAYPYVMERATREAIVNHKLAGKELVKKISKKLALQKPHLRKYFVEWEKTRLPFLTLFSAYLQVTRKLTPYMTKDDSFTAVRNHWLSLQQEFAEKMEKDGELRTVCERFVPEEHLARSEGSGGGDGDGVGDARQTRRTLRLDVIKFVGAQGCGKSTMSRVLFFLLAEANHKPRWLNQDEAGNRNTYLAAIQKAIHESYTIHEKMPEGGAKNPNRITHLILDKMNLDKRTNNDYNCLPEPAVTVFFTFDNEADEEESARRTEDMTELLFSRVLNRGSRHRTIRIPDDISAAQREQEVNKVHKFLSQAVRACEFPEDDPNVLLVDVKDTLETQIASIWSALQENGFYDVPDLDTLHLDVAIDVANRYERLLAQQGKAPLYAALAVVPADSSKLLDVVDGAMLENKKVQREFHVTTKYFVGDPDPLYFVALAELEGSSIDLALEAVAGDPRGVAIRVRNTNPKYDEQRNEQQQQRYENDIVAHLLAAADPTAPGAVPRHAFPCANAVAHITVANAQGTAPVYSNELLARDPGQPIPGNVTVRATFCFR